MSFDIATLADPDWSVGIDLHALHSPSGRWSAGDPRNEHDAVVYGSRSETSRAADNGHRRRADAEARASDALLLSLC